MNQSNNPTPGALPYQRQFGPSRHSLYPCFGAPAATPAQIPNTCFITVASLRKSHPRMMQRRYDPCFRMNRPTNMPGAFTVQGYSIATNPCFGPSRLSNPHFGAPVSPPPHSNTCFVSASSLRKAYPQMTHTRNNHCFK